MIAPQIGVMMALLLGSAADAAPPADGAPDPEMKQWFESLRQPGTGKPCCSVSDCRFVASTTRDGQYEIEIDGWRYRIPGGVVIEGLVNPNVKSVACYTTTLFGPPLPPGHPPNQPQDVIEILCFIPSRITS